MKRLFAKAIGALALSVTAVSAQPFAQPMPAVMQPAPAHVQPMPTSTGTINTPIVVRTLAADPAKPEKIGTPTATPIVNQSGCCNAWYNQGCQQGCGSHGSLVGGFGVDYLKPHFNRNPAFTVSSPGSIVVVDHDWDYEMGFVLWGGYVGCDGFGVRLRYREFDDGSNPLLRTVATGETVLSANSYVGHNVSSGTVGQSIGVDSTLEYDIFDLEATQNLKFGSYNLVVVAGLRYVYMNQSHRAGLFDAAGTLLDAADAGHNFRGIGPTFALEGYKSISDSCGVFATSRASLLYGDASYDSHQYYVVTGDVLSHTSIDYDDLIAIFELELGVQCSKDFGGGRLFAQLGIRGDFWVGGNNASRAAGDDLDDLSVTDFGLFGLMLRLGVDF
jgi:hypothetical protein